jgi:sec-independent protein translocase protein TatC
MTDSSIEQPLTNVAQEEMPLMEHLRELRTRLIYSICYLVVFAILSFNYSESVFDILSRPYFQYFPKQSLIGTGPAEAFILRIKLAFFSAILLSCPLIFHQVWLFVAPGLYEDEKKLFIPFILVSTGLFITGAYLCYEFLIPVTYSFFAKQYQTIQVTPQIRISEHLSIVLKCILGAGVAFEIPVLSFLLARSGVITHKHLISWSRYAVIAIFVLAGILTPTPDVMTQVMFAVPLFILYGISIVVAYVAVRKNEGNKEDKAD